MSFIINPYRHAGGGATNGLLTGLESYYKLDEASGTIADSHGSNDGTLTGATYGATGIINNAIDFDGSGDYINLGNLTMPSAWTWNAWVNVPTIGAGESYGVVVKGNLSSSNESFRIAIQYSSGSAVAFCRAWFASGGVGSSTFVKGSTDLAGGWHMVTVTWDGDDLRVYADASSEGTSLGNGGSTQSSSDNVYIGTGTTSLWNMNGSIDEVGFWSRILDSTDVANLYKGGAGMPYSEFTS